MTPNSADDPWFDLIPQGLIEFDERGRVLRSNPASHRLLGERVPTGMSLNMASARVQTLTSWDAPLTLLSLTPTSPPLWVEDRDHVGNLCATVHVNASAEGSTHYLCSIATKSAPEGIEPNQAPEQLLHELSTILESSPAGIAYQRGDVLVRCNRRFERMLGFKPGSLTGMPLDDLLAGDPRINRVVTQSNQELLRSGQYESELEITLPDQTTRWYALSIRRIGSTHGPIETIAVLSDITGMRSQQAQLEALGRDRDLMFSLSAVGIAFVRNGVVQSANPALSTLLERSQTDIVGHPLTALFAGEHHAADAAEMMDALHQHGVWHGERALGHPRGMPLWAELNLRLVNQVQPEEGFIVSFVNVDDRHRAEQNLTLQAERTRAILDSVFVGIVNLDSHGIVWMNRSARRMFGGDLNDFVGLPLSTVATSDIDHPFRMTDYLDDLQDGQSHTFECQVVGRDGRVFWVVGNAVVTLTGANERQITYALLDIDRRRQAEALSAEAQATLQRIIEMAPMAIMLFDARTLRVIQANQGASAFINTEANAALLKTPEMFLDGERAKVLRSDLMLSLDAGSPLHREYSLQQGGNTQAWDVNYLPLSREDQSADQLLMVASDVTEQRAAEQARLDAAITQREMLVKEVHHRIKNNLQGVAGLLQQIAARKPEVASAISEVVGQVQAIAQVYGLQVGSSGPLHLQSVVEAIAQSVQRTFGRQILLSFDGPTAGGWQLPEAESIPIALSLNELLTNAHKHGKGMEPLTCAVHCEEQGVHVDIRNPGHLADGFSVDRVRGGVSGLGLVRALLPRRSSKLSMVQDGPLVLTRIELTPPGVVLVPVAPTTPERPSGQQIALWPQ